MSQENRHFAPSVEFAKNAIAKPGIYAEAKADRQVFGRSREKIFTGTSPSRKSSTGAKRPLPVGFTMAN